MTVKFGRNNQGRRQSIIHFFFLLFITERSLEVSVYNTHTFAHFNPGFHDELTEHNHGNIVTEHAIRIRHTGQYYIYVNVHFCSNVTNEVSKMKFRFVLHICIILVLVKRKRKIISLLPELFYCLFY